MKSSFAPGIAFILCAIALAAVSVLELAPGDARGDGDNPADSLKYLAEFGLLYSYSGLALVIGGVCLVVGVVGVRRLMGHQSLAFAAASTIGMLGGGFLLVAGVMRMQANGTVPHIAGLNQSWGEAAYLAVQLAGTQGLLSTGMLATAAWLVAFGLVLWRRGVRAPALAAALPALVLLILLGDLALPFLVAPDWFFVIYILAIVAGLPICSLVFGLALLRDRTRSSLKSSDVLQA
jgi:hypothetical protein